MWPEMDQVMQEAQKSNEELVAATREGDVYTLIFLLKPQTEDDPMTPEEYARSDMFYDAAREKGRI